MNAAAKFNHIRFLFTWFTIVNDCLLLLFYLSNFYSLSSPSLGSIASIVRKWKAKTPFIMSLRVMRSIFRHVELLFRRKKFLRHLLLASRLNSYFYTDPHFVKITSFSITFEIGTKAVTTHAHSPIALAE